MPLLSVKQIQSKLTSLEETQGDKMSKIYTVAGYVVFTFSQVLVKGSTLSVYQTLYFRGLVICCFILFTTQEKLYIVSKQERRLLLIYSFLSSIESFLYFTGMRILSMAEGTTMYLTYGIFTQFQAYWILQEPIKSSTIRNCCISFVGVILITKPSSLLNIFDSGEVDNHLQGCAIMISASFIFGLSQTLLRLIDIPAEVKLHYNHGWNMVLGCLATLFIEQVEPHIYNFQNFAMIMIISLSSYIAHLLWIKAWSMVSIAKLAPYTFSQLLTALLCDFLIFQKMPDVISLFGSCFIILSVVLTMYGK